MRRLLLLAAIAAGGALGSAGVARADGGLCGPYSTSVTWPSVTPPGWYTNTYWHNWYYPWYAYYNYTNGPYANWMLGGGYAGYAYHGTAGMYYSHKPPAEPYIGVWYTGVPELPGGPVLPGPAPAGVPLKKDEKPKVEKLPKDVKPKDEGGTVSVTLPADAKLLFNGVAASGSGGKRTFLTPPLVAGQSYKYELTAEVVRDGRTERATGTVIVRGGETAAVALTPVPVVVVASK